MDKSSGSNRRRFLKQMGSLVVALPVWTGAAWVSPHLWQQELPGALRRHSRLDAWLEVLEDNRVRVFTGKIELGQGITTVIRQIAADELRLDWEDVEVVMADTARTPDEGYTAGSGSVKGSAMSVRYAAAAARVALCRMAASRWSVDDAEVEMQAGQLQHLPTGRKLTLQELLAGQALEIEVDGTAMPLSQEQYRYTGTSQPNEAIREIVAGRPHFIQDLRFEQMLHARVSRPPAAAAYLQEVNETSFRQDFADDCQVIRSGSLVAVLADREYTVAKALPVLERHATWSKIENLPQQERLKSWVAENTERTEMVVDKVDPRAQMQVSKVFRGSYFKPYIMHGAIGPACAIARYDEGKLQVWTSSQGVYPLRAAICSFLGLSPDQVTVTGVPGPGCYGHNAADDAAADAAWLATQIPGRHVRVQWTRDQEHAWEALGSAMRMDIEAGLDADGRISWWKTDVWTDSHSTRPNGDAGTVLPARYAQNPQPLQGRGYLGGGYRNAEPYYDIASKEIRAHFYSGPLRVSSLRSLGAYANVFAIESTVEEMARSLNQHPLDFRIRQLKDDRAVAVIQKLKEKTATYQAAERRGIGYGFARYKNSDAFCAVAAVVHCPEGGKVQLEHMWAVIEAGEVMNPDGLIRQTEGAMVQAASWTLYEQVKFSARHITSQDWSSYPIIRFNEAPKVEVDLIQRPDLPPHGGGEAGTPPTPAAITNAISAVTGQRIFNLPVD